jgi:hypothetical protein
MTLQKLTRRYRSAYRVGRFVNELGILAKVGAAILFIAPTYLGIRAADAIRQYAPVTQWIKDNLQLTLSDQQAVLVAVGIVLGIICFVLLWLVGTIVSAAAQILRAVLDTAVNTSPFFTPEEKEKIIL